MGIQRTVAPSSTVPVVAVQDVKQGLDIAETETGHDDFLRRLINGAVATVERWTGRSLLTQTWKLTLDAWPTNSEIALPYPPLQSVTSIQYVDSDGVTQSVDSSDYRIDDQAEPARITPAFNAVWPTARTVTNAVTVTYVAGYGDKSTDIPDDIIDAIHVLVYHRFEEPASTDIPDGAKRLLKSLSTGVVLGTMQTQ